MKKLIQNLSGGFLLLILAACGGGGGDSSEAAARTSGASQPTQFSSALSDTNAASNKSIDAGLWNGVVESPDGGEYNVKVVIDDLGGALIELSFINDEKSFELNALKLFGVPDYWGNQDSAAGFDLARSVEKVCWKDTTEDITYAVGHVETENGGLSVSIDIPRDGAVYTLMGHAEAEETMPVGSWLDSGVADAAVMRFIATDFSANDSSFLFVNGNCVMSGTYLADSTDAPLSRVSIQADCVGTTDEAFSGSYVGFAYRSTAACGGNPNADVLQFSAASNDSALKIMPYACW